MFYIGYTIYSGVTVNYCSYFYPTRVHQRTLLATAKRKMKISHLKKGEVEKNQKWEVEKKTNVAY